ncbi:helix-turn-helix transcriptional regulator [Streptomyces sp. NPDC006658]|uniref:helix-turn-helix transcriptional regulator n=1 Tax=Streptomyces sp. NPDC006658 TaxID=3156900 RepID=UPI0034020576
MKIEEVIGANVQWIREDQGMTQAQLGEAVAAHLGKPWSRQAVSAAEKGRRAFSAADLLALALVLDVTIPSFFLLRDAFHDDVQLPTANVAADDYMMRVFHRSDVKGGADLLTRSSARRLREAHARVLADTETLVGAVSSMNKAITHLDNVIDAVEAKRHEQ